MKSAYPLFLILVLFFSCEKKDGVKPAATTITPINTNTAVATNTLTPTIDTDIYWGYYYDSASGDNMSQLWSDYEPRSLFYVIHTKTGQIVFTKNGTMFVAFYCNQSFLLFDTFSVNNQNFYSSRVPRNGAKDGYFFNQTGVDTLSISVNDSLYFNWSYTSYYGCYDPATHICQFAGVKQK